jgi:hypothetical protein
VKGRSLLFWASAAVLVAGLAWLYGQDAPMRAGVAFHHVASVRELARGEFPPRHNLVEGHLPQPHYGPYLVALGFVARVTGLPPVTVLYGAGLVLLAAYLLVFRALARRLVGDAAAGWSALCATLLWGPWPAPVVRWAAWGWPGTTSLADAYNFFYPQHAAVLLLLVLLCLLIPATPEDPDAAPRKRLDRWRAVGALVLGALLVATHPLTGFALAVAAMSLLAAELWRGPRRPLRLAGLLALPALALLLATLWPYYPVLELLKAFRLPPPEPFSSAVTASPPPLAAIAASAAPTLVQVPFEPSPAATPATPAGLMKPPPLPVNGTLGPALFGLGWAVVLALRGQPFLLIWSGGLLALAFVPQVPLHDRVLLFAAVPLQIAFCALLESAWSSRRVAARVAALTLLAAGAASAAQRTAWVLDQEPPSLAWLTRVLPEDAVVLADGRTSNAVAGITGRKVVAPEGPDMLLVIRGGWQRVVDVDRFFATRTGAAERQAIVRRWGVTHVLIDTLGAGGPSLPWPVVASEGGYVLYDVR